MVSDEGGSPISYAARIAYKWLKLVIRDEPEIHAGNLENYLLFLAVSGCFFR